jgi:hypothetical protein
LHFDLFRVSATFIVSSFGGFFPTKGFTFLTLFIQNLVTQRLMRLLALIALVLLS